MSFTLYRNYALNSQQEINTSNTKESLIAEAKKWAKGDPGSRYEVIRFLEDGEAVTVFEQCAAQPRRL